MISRCLLAVAVVVSLQAQATPSRPDEGPVYQHGDPGIVPAKLVKQFSPHYTSAAMREKVSGTVLLEGIVEIDGTLSTVHVVRSLHPELDEEAVTAAAQWRFAPATKDGRPVRIRATIEMQFSLRTWQEMPFELPEIFQHRESAPATRADEPWSNDLVDTNGLRVRVEHPRTWAVRPSADSMLLTLENRSGGAARFMTVARARTAQMQSLEPAAVTAVQQLATAFRQMAIGGPGGTALKSGQVRVGGRLWFWLQISAAAGNLPELRPEVKDALTAEFDLARAWTFSTITAGRLLVVDFILLSPSAAAPDDQSVAAAGQAFAALLQRVAIEPKP